MIEAHKDFISPMKSKYKYGIIHVIINRFTLFQLIVLNFKTTADKKKLLNGKLRPMADFASMWGFLG